MPQKISTDGPLAWTELNSHAPLTYFSFFLTLNKKERKKERKKFNKSETTPLKYKRDQILEKERTFCPKRGIIYDTK
jgi:hypothetical protein